MNGKINKPVVIAKKYKIILAIMHLKFTIKIYRYPSLSRSKRAKITVKLLVSSDNNKNSSRPNYKALREFKPFVHGCLL